MTKIFLIYFYILIVTGISCSSINRHKDLRARFVLFGNTSPESPFTGSYKGLSSLIRSINGSNPAFVIHTGNIVHGGYSWMGINKNDIESQYRKFIFISKKLNSPLYTVVGDKDSFNGFNNLYNTYTGREDYYSFNYGSLHFIVINNIENFSEFGRIKQDEWIKKDIELNNNVSRIFVISHTPLFNSSGNPVKPGSNNKFHSQFLKYKVNYVFSGGPKNYYLLNKENIYYYVTGNYGRGSKTYRKYLRYYIVDFSGTGMIVNEKTVEINK